MPFTNQLRLKSKIFNRGEFRRAVRAANIKSAKEFKASTKNKMVIGPHTGRLYAPKRPGRGLPSRGAQFLRAHRASRPGERLSPDTLNLLNSVLDRSTGDLVHEVYVDDRAWYAKYWQEDAPGNLKRPTMVEKDVEDFAPKAMQNFKRSFDSLI